MQVTAIFASLVILSLVGLVSWLVIRYVKEYQERLFQVWQRTAQQLGGHFQPPVGPWYNRGSMNITATVSGTSVLVDHYTVNTGKSSVTYTRIRANAEGAGKLSIKIYKEHIFSTLGKALGFQDVQLGDPSFDPIFMVKANDEELARIWIHAEVRRLIAGALPYHFTLKDGAVTTIRVRIEDNPELLEAAVRATAELASAGKALLRRWRAVAAEVGGTLMQASSAWQVDASSLTMESRGVPVEIDTLRTEAREVLDEPRLFTRVRGRLPKAESELFGVFSQNLPRRFARLSPALPANPQIVGRYQIVGQDVEKTKQRLTASICSRILKLMPYALTVEDQHVSLFFLGMETDPARLRMAAELVGELAAPPTRGPYR